MPASNTPTLFLLLLIQGVTHVLGSCGRQAIPPYEDNLYTRIVGGREARKHSWPWQAHLGAYIDGIPPPGYDQFCGATIIDARWVLTAAHCIVPGWKDPYVRVGQHNKTLPERTARNYKIKTIYPHPEYMNANALPPFPDPKWSHDIALLEIEEPIVFSREVSPACLPKQNHRPPVNAKCFAIGWGVVEQRNHVDPTTAPTSAPLDTTTRQPVTPTPTAPSEPVRSEVLKQTTIFAVDTDICNGTAMYDGQVPEKGFCGSGYGHDTCQSDSGGPLLCKNSDGAFEVVGVVSWGKGCADPKYAGIYTNVGDYIDWINQVTGLNF